MKRDEQWAQWSEEELREADAWLGPAPEAAAERLRAQPAPIVHVYLDQPPALTRRHIVRDEMGLIQEIVDEEVQPAEVQVRGPESRPEVHVRVPPRARRRRIKRDRAGLIEEIVEEEASDGPRSPERG